jgi:hypothetical protein
LNALDNEMWHGIGEACRVVDAAPDVRVAVLMGAGGCYGEMSAWLDWETAQASGPLLSEDRTAGLKAAAERKRADFKGR